MVNGLFENSMKSALLNILGSNAISQLLIIASTPLLTRLYDKHVFGVLGIATTLALLLSAMLSCRLEYSIHTDVDPLSIFQSCLSFIRLSVIVILLPGLLLISLWSRDTQCAVDRDFRHRPCVTCMLRLIPELSAEVSDYRHHQSVGTAGVSGRSTGSAACICARECAAILAGIRLCCRRYRIADCSYKSIRFRTTELAEKNALVSQGQYQIPLAVSITDYTGA